MSLRFITGRAGTGKTHHIMEDISSRLKNGADGHLIYLVPEQATFHTEKNLLEHCQAGGLMKTQVLSFQRLAWQVLQETGGGIFPALNDVGKNLILRHVLEKNKHKIKTFARVLDRPGFLENLALVIEEFKIYGITPGRLADSLDRLNAAQQSDGFRVKLEDLKLLYEGFEEYVNKGYLDSQDYLEKLATNLHQAGFIEKSEFWLDGFVGFTPREYDVVREILLRARRVHVSVCLDREHLKAKLPPTHVFYQSWETYQKMLALAHEINCPVEDPVLLDYSGEHRFSRKKELAFLEESFVKPERIFQGEVSALKLVAAANRRAELETAAREIIKLCREEGFRFQDITVLIRDFTHYEYLLPAVFSDYRIPVFLDKKRPLRHHPLSELLRSALETLENGWNYEAVFRYLKTDLVPLSRQEVDLLENYCLTHGIRGSRWKDGKPWTYKRRYTLGEDAHDDGTAVGEDVELVRINTARMKAVAALARMEDLLQEAKTVRDFASALYALLDNLAVDSRLQNWSAKAKAAGRLEEALLHSQVWGQVIALLDQLVAVLGDQEVVFDEFNRIFNSGLDSLELGLIPPGLDQVLVGSLDRTRNPNMKAVFVLGVNEGILPARCTEEGLLSDEEREILAGLELSIAPTSEVRLFAEQYLVYTAMTRASDYLWVSYAQADDDGKALSPSLLFKQLEGLFSQEAAALLQFCPVEPTGSNDEEFIASPAVGLGYLAAALRQAKEGKVINPLWWEVYNWYLQQPVWREHLQGIAAGLFQVNNEENLSGQQIRLLYGNRLFTSISRLERFKACPFAHFLNFGLRVKEREEFRLKAPDLGQLFHAAIENIYRYLKQDNLELAEISPEQLTELAGKVVDELVPRLQNELLLSTSRYRYLTRKFKKTVVRAALILREHEQRGTFRPVGLEVSFGMDGGLPGLQFELADGSVMVIRGRIDRVDKAKDEKGSYLRVIDYKSGRPSISLMEIFYGLKLQLLAYLNVVLKQAHSFVAGEVRPGGVFYFRIQDPFIADEGPLENSVLEKKILQELKMKGYMLKEPDVVRLMDQGISGYSDLVPAALNAQGEFYRNNTNLLTEQEFARIGEHVEDILREIGEEIMAGKVAIHPYRFKGNSPCKVCAYQAACRFDAGADGQKYRVLPVKEQLEVWQELGLGEGGEHDEQLDS